MKNRLRQMKSFWASVFLKRSGNPITVRRRESSLIVPHEVCAWLSGLFSMQAGEWAARSALSFPYSDLYVLEQHSRTDVPREIALKRIRILLEDDRDLSVQGVRDEQKALFMVNAFDGISGVRVPKLYGASEDHCCLAIDYLRGVRFINVLLESPLKCCALSRSLSDYASSLVNLGRWLRRLHEGGSALVCDQPTVAQVVERDAAEIKLKVEGLRESRPADFPIEMCRRLVDLCDGLAQSVVRHAPELGLKHGDFTLVNVLYDNGHLSVLDFTYFGHGLPEDDLARIYLDFLNIDFWSLAFGPEKRGTLGSAFLKGYGKEFTKDSDPIACFYLLKHALINLFMYTKQWGRPGFLNPFLCRVLYSIQRRFLLQLVDSCSMIVASPKPRSLPNE